MVLAPVLLVLAARSRRGRHRKVQLAAELRQQSLHERRFSGPGGTRDDEGERLATHGFHPRLRRHSRFCTCSRSFSISSFMRSTSLVILSCAVLEPIVLTSRCISWS